ncbi:ABC transporter permease [Streptomonospora nanhaiensis]|uniref:ABC transporter permease n=1 Tax=Streptomonospora nanhaiensis TaxID=1323731 RepID=UPI001C3905F5|nr:ABC transporter permease [Streptomonospora nanhaiensis]MBV2363160.1 ABC transporter permease [Streptomonospora nanhaiensis]MBX9387435.1 ABC transporter permease [Streptomonospora nanhaiensis]
MRTLTKLAAVETKLLVREPGAVFALLIPLFILVAFGGGISRGDTVLVPMATTMAVGLVGLYLLPTTLATYRERGILRRLSLTPVRPGSLLAVQLLLQVVLAAVAVGLLLGVGVGVLGARPPAVLHAAAALVLGTAALFSVGLVIAALAPNGRAANGVGVLAFFPLAYLGGLMQPPEHMPAILAAAGGYTPMGALRLSLHEAWSGAAVAPLPLVVLALYAVALSLVAAWSFRWE